MELMVRFTASKSRLTAVRSGRTAETSGKDMAWTVVAAVARANVVEKRMLTGLVRWAVSSIGLVMSSE